MKSVFRAEQFPLTVSHGMSPEDGKRMPLVLQTSGGTIGLPRPMLYARWTETRRWRFSAGAARSAVALHRCGSGDGRQRRQINVILGFPVYLRHMALVARDEMGIDVRTLGVRLIGTHLGREDRRQIESLWGGAVRGRGREDARSNDEYFCVVERVGRSRHR